MKENDEVRLTVEKEVYTRCGFYKGAQGIICDPRKIDGQWLVCFWQEDSPNVGYLEVDEEDLEVVYKAAELKEGVTVLYLSNREKYAAQGITSGMFGVIERQCDNREYWNVKFEIGETQKVVAVYYNDIIPLRDDEVQSYREKVQKALKRRKTQK